MGDEERTQKIKKQTHILFLAITLVLFAYCVQTYAMYEQTKTYRNSKQSYTDAMLFTSIIQFYFKLSVFSDIGTRVCLCYRQSIARFILIVSRIQS